MDTTDFNDQNSTEIIPIILIYINNNSRWTQTFGSGWCEVFKPPTFYPTDFNDQNSHEIIHIKYL